MNDETKPDKKNISWKEKLSPDQYRVMREGDTEPAFTGKYVHEKMDGMYVCAACGAELFSSKAKFDSGTGWPSFTDPVVAKNIELKRDLRYGMERTEVLCRRCGSHLGHVFDDGPGVSGKRYCINSICLDLKAERNGTKVSKDGGTSNPVGSTNQSLK
jgi:peptide-methionine (R)-S-oxide reductase